jgi:hypothetical protein
MYLLTIFLLLIPLPFGFIHMDDQGCFGVNCLNSKSCEQVRYILQCMAQYCKKLDNQKCLSTAYQQYTWNNVLESPR